MGRFFSKDVRRALWQRAAGDDGIARCETLYGWGCGAPLHPHQYVFDHVDPYEISHDSTLENGQVLCDSCNANKTFICDIPTIAKSNRVRDRHIGARPPARHPLPCGRNTSRSKTIAGGVVTRLTQGQKLARTRDKLGGVFSQDGEPRS